MEKNSKIYVKIIMITPIEIEQLTKLHNTQPIRTIKLIVLNIIFLLSAFSPTEKSDEIITAKENRIMQTIVTIDVKYSPFEKMSSNERVPFIISIIIDISVMLLPSLPSFNPKSLTVNIGKHIHKSGENIRTKRKICSLPPNAEVLILLSTLSTASCSLIAFSWSA